MAANWRGIVPVLENQDRRPLWQRRTSRRPPATVAESGSESGAGTTSSTGSRSSSDEDDRMDDRMSVPQSRMAQQLSPIFTNKPGVTRFNDRSPTSTSTIVGRSSSFREADVEGYPSAPGGMGVYRRNGSPYHSSRYPPISARGASAGDHLTADYVPSWRPDRRFSTPAVPRSRGSFSRSPSPRFIAKKDPQGQFQYFRSRAASLPNGPINAAINSSNSAKRRGSRQQNSDNWPQTRSPSRVEQRFLNLTESADYDKLRAFVIGAKGELVERGFCYRHRSDTNSSSSGGSTGPTASPNEDAKITTSTSTDHQNGDLFASRVVPKYQILVIGAPSVGKSSLLSLLKKSQQRRCDEIPNLSSVDSTEPGVATVLPVLICGEEVHLEFYEFCVSEEHLWSSIAWQSALVVYSISDKRSFSSAADALYQIRALSHARNKKALRDGTAPVNLPIPIVLVANKIDLERQRQVHDQDGMELAKSYDCRFLDVSVELTHHVEDLLSALINEIWRYIVSSYRQNHMQSLGGPQSSRDEEETPSEDKKPRRFSFRRSKQPKQSPRGSTGGQPRSSRARSLYTLPAGLPAALSQSVAPNNHDHRRGGGGFFSRLLGRRAVQSCEDLFSRLLRG